MGVFLENTMTKSATRRKPPAPPPPAANAAPEFVNAAISTFDIGYRMTNDGPRFGIVIGFNVGAPKELQATINAMPPGALPDFVGSIMEAVGAEMASRVVGTPCRIAFDPETGTPQRIKSFIGDTEVDLIAKVKVWAAVEDKVTRRSNMQ
jgi:hypothetical protein